MEKEEKPLEKKKGRGGRKPKPPQDLASEEIKFRVTEKDYKKLDDWFRQSAYRHKSEMYHDLMFHQKLALRDSTNVLLATEMQHLVREIKAIGTNYNQVVKKINSLTDGRPVPPEVAKLVELTAQLGKAQSEFHALLLQLREKWLQG
ncbi:plasmid mobilization protein [Rufibacter latericius]|uniref:Plasmid mobilization relaxosome protein MobC n=1 Tax=Rufibacter latericius TaxID=2487040 RepID=A0A3M9MFY7_9BACT|nr:hypothetical protein [Rufibacter latericius]RNI24105.1 hypothetical protein EFB08_17170 [Rufibacter latericius]